MTEDAQIPTGPIARPAYDGSVGEVGRIALVNATLGLLTLGFYRFWGKTKLRRYLWRNISFQGDALEYTGLPREMFIGFLIALAVLIPLAICFGIAEQMLAAWSLAAQQTVQTVYSLIFLFLFQFAYYRARRYRLTRTSWRGIRGGQTGSSVKYGLISLGQYFVLGASFGLTLPLMNTVLQRFRMNNTWLGDRQFKFDGRAGDLFGRWLLAWIFLVPTLGLTYVWYKAAELRYFAKCTTYENLRLELAVTGGQLFGIYALFVLSLIVVAVVVGGIAVGFMGVSIAGLGTESSILQASSLLALGPLVMIIGAYIAFSVLGTVLITHRLAGLLATRLSVIGAQDFDAIAQSSRTVPTSGEGLADALDVGGL